MQMSILIIIALLITGSILILSSGIGLFVIYTWIMNFWNSKTRNSIGGR